MNSGRTIMAQLLDFLPQYEFNKIVKKYNGNHKVKTFTCWEQLIVMMFAQLANRESLRDIESCLSAYSKKLYHCGIKSTIAKSTLADANERRDWMIFSEYASLLIERARVLYKDDGVFSDELKSLVYVLDSTTIDLCLNLFPWAVFRKNKGAVKMHTIMDISGSIPTIIWVTDGSIHDVNMLDMVDFETGAIYVMDKAYIDFERLYNIHLSAAYFVIREKENMKFRRVYSREVDKEAGVKSDQTIKLTGVQSVKKYPEHIRRVKFYDVVENRNYFFLTNNFKFNSLDIARLYKERWGVELLFKWIKQHLRIKKFFGTSYNAVCIQIWIAITSYVLILIIKKEMKLKQTPYTILQILSVSLFEKTPINHLFENLYDCSDEINNSNQLSLFD